MADPLDIIGKAISKTPVGRVASAAAKIAKDTPKILEANKALDAAKKAEKQIDAILDKPKITAADVKKVETLEKTVKTNIEKAVDLGASTAKNSPVKQVETAVKEKVADVKAQAPKAKTTETKPQVAKSPEEAKAQAEAKAKTTPTTPKTSRTTSAAKTEEAPPAPKTTPKTAVKAADDGKPPSIVRRVVGKIDDLPKGLLPGMLGPIAGAGIATTLPSTTTPSTSPVPIPPNIEIPDIDLPPATDGDGTPSDGGKGGDGDKGDGSKGGGPFDSGPNFDDGGTTPPPPVVEEEPPAEEPPTEDRFDKLWLILKAKLIAAGLPEKTVEDSVEYFRTIIKDAKFAGPDEIENVVDQYLYLKEYQPKSGSPIQSPYYRDFGIYNEKLKKKLLPKDLVPTVLGYKQIISRYKLNDKFATEGPDGAIQKYLINEVSVAELDERANAARLRSLNADPFYVKSLMQLGYITEPSQLTDFFLDPEIGTLTLESRRKTAAFSTEAVRRVSQETGITLDTEFATQQAARLASLGYSEAQITQAAGTGYENIAEQLRPTEKLSGIYESPVGEAAGVKKIQTELEAEQFLGMASQRRKKLAEQETRAFQGQAGVTTGAFRTSTLGAI